MKYFSLFSGIGGFEYGIEKAMESINRTENRKSKENTQTNQRPRFLSTQREGISKTTRQNDEQSNCQPNSREFTCIGYSEINKYAKAIYRYHYPEHKNYGDATKIVSGKLPNFDLLVGGFPCQSFSIAGKRKGMSGEDIRGTLFFEIWRIARDKRPRTLLLENVPGLLSSQGGEDFQTILQSLDEIGYDVEWDCLNSKNFGVPQSRPRVFIIGHLRGQGFKKVFPVGSNGQTHNRKNTPQTSCLKSPLRSQRDKPMIADFRGDEGLRIRKDGMCPTIKRRAESEDFYNSPLIMRDGRDNRNCLRSGRTTELGIKGQSIRRLTPTECERLQAFPDGWTEWGIDESIYKNCGICKECDYVDYDKIYSDIKCVIKISDTQRYKCLGNAVTTSVIKEIIKKMFV